MPEHPVTAAAQALNRATLTASQAGAEVVVGVLLLYPADCPHAVPVVVADVAPGRGVD